MKQLQKFEESWSVILEISVGLDVKIGDQSLQQDACLRSELDDGFEEKQKESQLEQKTVENLIYSVQKMALHSIVL